MTWTTWFYRVVMFIAAFVAVAFIAVTYQTQVQARQIKHAAAMDRARAYHQCMISRGNSKRLNAFLDQIVHAVKTSDALTDAEKAQRVAAYLSIKATLPACGRPSK